MTDPGIVKFSWQGTLVLSVKGDKNKGDQVQCEYINKNFKKEGKAGNKGKSLKIQKIAKEIKEKSGLTQIGQLKTYLLLFLGILIAVAGFLIPLPPKIRLIPRILAIFISSIIFFIAIKLYFDNRPFGPEGKAVNRIKNFLHKNESKWEKELGKIRYALKWNIEEKFETRLGRSVYYPYLELFFSLVVPGVMENAKIQNDILIEEDNMEKLPPVNNVRKVEIIKDKESLQGEIDRTNSKNSVQDVEKESNINQSQVAPKNILAGSI